MKEEEKLNEPGGGLGGLTIIFAADGVRETSISLLRLEILKLETGISRDVIRAWPVRIFLRFFSLRFC